MTFLTKKFPPPMVTLRSVTPPLEDSIAQHTEPEPMLRIPDFHESQLWLFESTHSSITEFKFCTSATGTFEKRNGQHVQLRNTDLTVFVSTNSSQRWLWFKYQKIPYHIPREMALQPKPPTTGTKNPFYVFRGDNAHTFAARIKSVTKQDVHGIPRSHFWVVALKDVKTCELDKSKRFSVLPDDYCVVDVAPNVRNPMYSAITSSFRELVENVH
ncbi:hypothetical protein MPER_09160 [Moniliophthora perniciosa FA553]|nr:hypothetical protein MPER_09160 [Moniliophthora perniciosa FA553]